MSPHVFGPGSRTWQSDLRATPIPRRTVLLSGAALPLGLMIGRQDLDPFEASTWAAFWKTHRGPGLQLNLIGSTHDTFTDFAALVPQVAPILGQPRSWVIAGVGTINGQRAVTVQRTYIGAYFDRYLRHRDSHLLAGPSSRYPEVRFAPYSAARD